MPTRTVHVVAFYEIDRNYGGPEEGGWWYDSGSLVRVSRVFKSEDAALAYARRANDLLHFLQRRCRPVSSVAYSGGRYAAEVYENAAPPAFPMERPHYE